MSNRPFFVIIRSYQSLVPSLDHFNSTLNNQTFSGDNIYIKHTLISILETFALILYKYNFCSIFHAENSASAGKEVAKVPEL